MLSRSVSQPRKFKSTAVTGFSAPASVRFSRDASLQALWLGQGEEGMRDKGRHDEARHSGGDRLALQDGRGFRRIDVAHDPRQRREQQHPGQPRSDRGFGQRDINGAQPQPGDGE